MHIKTNRIALLWLLIACFLVSFQVNVSNTSAYTASITTNDSIELDITPNGNGTSIHSESINVASDCRAGYNLTIATPEGSDLYKYENNAQSSNTASFTAVDGTSALNSSSNTNKWGYTLTSDPNSNTVFSPLSTTASILKTPSQTASPEADINDTFNINYGAKVDNTVEAGTYQMANNGAIVYYLTMDTTCTQYTVSFNPNGGTGTMDDQGIEAGEPTNLSANDFTAPAFGSSYEDANGDTIVGTANTYWRFNGWNTAIDGTGTPYDNEEEVEDLVGAGSTITLYAQWEALSAMVVNFNTNGMEFEDGTTSNTLGYYHSCVDKYVSQPSYSHTANINDDGTQIDSTKYDNNLATKDVITIPNAESLHVTIKYGTENSYDMLYVFQGEYTGSVTRNMNAGQLAKYMGGNNTTTTVELDIPGDTATFAFYSDSSGQYWGYHATVVGYFVEEPESYTSTTQVCTRSLVEGEYKAPATDSLRTFYGWSEDQFATVADYDSADKVLEDLPGDNGDTKTLYAIWKNKLTINYNANGGTGTTASQTVAAGEKITLKSNSFTAPANMAFGGWNTEPDGTGTSYSANTTFTAPNSVAYNDSLTLYAQWLPQYTITYINNCQTYASANASCTTTVSNNTSEQKINLTNNPSTGTETGTLAAYNKWALTGWKIKEWTTNADGTGTTYPVSSTYTVPAGSSVGSGITLYAYWVPVYSIQYDGNGADNPNGMGTTDGNGKKSVKHINVSEGQSVTLLPSNYKRSGYGSIGWSTDADAWAHFTDNDNTNDPIIYGPMETITAPMRTSQTMTLYAVWVPAETNNGNPVYLQDFGTSECNGLTRASIDSNTGTINAAGSITALTDKRDNEVYAVGRLTDGNCWMIENLRLESAGTTGNNINDPSVTNESLSQGTYGGTPGVHGTFRGLADPESVFSSPNSIYKSAETYPVDTYDPLNNILEDVGRTDGGNLRIPHYFSTTSNIPSNQVYVEDFSKWPVTKTSPKYIESTVYSYGNYYNWHAAMATTEYYQSASTSEAAGSSLCPREWHLPSAGSLDKEYSLFTISLGGTGGEEKGDNYSIVSRRLYSFPNNYVNPGYYLGSYVQAIGTLAFYWSRSANSYGYAYSLTSLSMNPAYSETKSDGISIRCLVSGS